MAFVNEQIGAREWQTIDHERNIILQMTGSFFPDGTPSFSLNVNGDVIGFEAFRSTKNLDNKKIKVIWDVRRIYLSPPFDNNPTKAKELIKESLDGFGFAASREHVGSVEVKFSLS